MLSRFEFVYPARTRVLVVPVNRCTKSNFDTYVSLLRSANPEIKLLEVPPIPELKHFNPQSYPNGRVLYDIVTSTNDLNILQLHNFEPFRKEFIVLAIGTYEDGLDTEEILHTLGSTFPNAIVHNSILFDTPDDVIKEKVIPSDHAPKSTFYHHDVGVVTGLDSILVEITRNFLHSLDNYVNSFTIVTLRSPVSEGKVLVKTISKNQKRFSSGNFISSLVESKMRLQHAGRKNKVMGNFYLLAGKYMDAMNEFSEAILALKKCEDYLWLGSALEGMLITIALLQYIGASFQMPVVALTAALQISTKKLHSLASLEPAARGSMESIRSVLSSNSTLQINMTGSTTPRNSFGSQRNSVNGELSDVVFPELFKLVHNKIVRSYQMSTSDFENRIPDVIFAEYILRATKFMIQIQRWGLEVTKSLTGFLDIADTTEQEKFKYYLREEILRELDNVYLIQLSDIDFVEQCNLYCVLASVYFDLKAHRKQSFILRTLLVSLSKKLEGKPASSSSNEISENIKQMSREGNHISSIYSLFEMLFEVYNITSKPEENLTDAYLNLQGNWITLQILLLRLCMNVAETMKDYPFLLKVCSLLLTRYTHCLPPNDQIRLKEMMDYSIFLSRRNNIDLQTPYWDPFIVRDAKLNLTRSSNELLPFAEYEKQGTTFETKPGVFDPYSKIKSKAPQDLLIVNDVYQLVITLQNPFAFEVEINELMITSENEEEIQTLQHLTRPVESNAASVTSQKTTKMKSTPSLGITNYKRPSNSTSNLINGGNASSPSNISPLAQVSQIVSDDPSSLVKHHPANLVIAPNSTQQFSVLFKSLSVGKITIKGFQIGLSNCKPQFFHIVDHELPSVLLKVKDLRLTKSIKRSDSLTESTSSPLSNILSNLESNNITERVSTKTITLHVLPPQPTLVLDSILITNGWLMLLEGERVKFTISLVNKSDVLINYLSFSFWDSTIEPLSKKLNQGYQSLTPAEIYEIEWFLLRSKPFSIVNKEEVTNTFKTIPPHEKVTIEYEIFCKRGIKELQIILDYSHRVSTDTTQSYVKQFYIPIGISIMPSLEIIGFHLLPLFSNTLRNVIELSGSGTIMQTQNLTDLLQFINKVQNSETEEIYEYCLLVFDLRNNWNLKLHSKIEYKPTGFQINEEVEASITTRYFLPIKRIKHSEIDLTRAIPSLRNKQFIKNYSISEAEDITMRKLFWLREELLDNLSGTWASSATKGPGTRYGDLQFRSIRLMESIIDILLLPEVQMESSIELENGDACPQVDGKYNLTTEEFYVFKTRIYNSGLRDIDGIFRHVPFLKNAAPNRNQLSIDRRILFNGVMQHHLGQVIKPQETVHLELSFTILETGVYEWGVVLDLLNGELQEQFVGLEPIIICAM